MNLKSKQAAKDLYLAFNRSETADHFTAQLFQLMAKADPGNQQRLAMSFPVEADIFQEWRNAPTERTFFDKYEVTFP